jgi:hypothetical protein
LLPKDVAQLKELDDINFLRPRISRRDQVVKIRCVIPIILSLKARLEIHLNSPGSSTSLVKTLLNRLCDRFSGNFELLGIKKSPELRKHFNELKFNSNVALMATALDRSYTYN